MRVFWHNGALMIEPESDREGQLLTELAGNIKFGRPSGMQNRIPSGEASSGEELLNRLVSNHETVPRCTADSHHKKHVVSINKLL
jgi:hypothetical protein